MAARSDRLEDRGSAAQANPFDASILGLGVVNPQAHDVARLVVLEGLSQIGHCFHRFPLEVEDDVRAAAVRLRDLTIRWATRGQPRSRAVPADRPRGRTAV